MNQHILKELQKLYPKVKIPFENDYQFYIDTLTKYEPSYSWLPKIIEQLKTLAEKVENITKYKMEKTDKVIQFFNILDGGYNSKPFTTQLNEFVTPKHEYFKKSFNDWSDKNIYISIDLCEANWSVYKKYSGIKDFFNMSYAGEDLYKKNFGYFLRILFNVDYVVSASKSYRQFVLGNTNPKKLASLQEYEMSTIATDIRKILDENNIISRNSDEIILEIFNDSENIDHLTIKLNVDNYKKIDDIIFVINHLTTDLPVKYNIFTMTHHTNFGEFVRVKNILNDKLETVASELFGVKANRFFMHFRTLILKEQLQEKDLLYSNEGFKCKWII